MALVQVAAAAGRGGLGAPERGAGTASRKGGNSRVGRRGREPRGWGSNAEGQRLLSAQGRALEAGVVMSPH